MSEPGTPTFDQIRVLLAVAEEGSFAGAARRLHRATSAVSYAINNLESQPGLILFDRSATRKPTLTEAGRAVLAEACAIGHSVNNLHATVKGLLGGLEAEVSLVVDVMLPTPRLVDALQGFQVAFPTVPLHLHVEALGAVTQLVLERKATIGISGPLNVKVEGVAYNEIGDVNFIPVAAPFHPLACHDAHPPGATRDHVQLVLTDRSPSTVGRDFRVLSIKTWRLADLGAKHALLLAGVGWGGMPEPVVRGDIEAGRLKELPLPDWRPARYTFHVVHRTDSPPGPAGHWLIERLSHRF